MVESKKNLLLRVVSQEKELLNTEVSQVSIPCSEGEITVLPHHIPLFAQVDAGQLKFVAAGGEHSIVVSKGFVDIHADGTVIVLVDSAIHARDISEQKAQEAIQAAKETMSHTQDQREMLMAEASLRRAMWELRVAQKTKKAKI